MSLAKDTIRSIVLVSGWIFSCPLAAAAQNDAGHTGTAIQALVGIEVSNSAADGASQTVRRGNGFLIRCDGRVLAPSGLLSDSITVAGQAESSGSQSITVIINPGTALEKRFKGRRPRYTPKDLGYSVFKVDDLHAPALRTLLPDSIETNAALELVSSTWDSTARRFSPPTRLQVKFAGAPNDPNAAPGSIAFADPLENVPAGAIVTGPDGMGVGIVTGSGTVTKCDRFVSFASLHKVTNCVTASSRADSTPAPKDIVTGPMVPVAAGRVHIGTAVAIQQPDMEGDSSACVAPFQIDQFEVTNEEYLAYWQTLPDDQKRKLGFRSNFLPWTWSRTDPPFPGEIAKFPVIGVTLPGAMGYAKWVGKRLPTPYEWLLAAFGPEGDSAKPPWVQKYITERDAAWRNIRDAHIGYLRQRPDLQNHTFFLGGFFVIPWIGRTPTLDEASTFSKEVIARFLNPVLNLYGDPMYLMAAGSRPLDVSPCGAQDMMLNASELVMPYPGPPIRGAARSMEIRWIPSPQDPDDPWLPRKAEAMTDGPPLPPLSRLYRRALMGATADEVLLWSHINETCRMLEPLAGCQLVMTPAAKVEATMWPRGMNPYTGLSRPSAFKLWQSPPERFRREMGLPVALEFADAHTPPGVQLFYYLPVGFRCAK